MDFTTINDLPTEMIIEIFSYLNVSDLKNASLVSKDWYDAHHHPKTLNRMILALNRSNFAEYKSVTSKRQFHNLMFHNVNFYEKHTDMKFWEELGPYLQYLMFRNCTFTINQLISILKTTQKLDFLKIEVCNFVHPFEDDSKFDSVKNNLKNVTQLKFEILTEDNYNLFNTLIEMMPNLNNLETDNTYSCVNDTIYNNLKKRASTLEGLYIYHGSPSEFMENITRIENLKLKRFNFNAPMSPTLLKNIINHQRSITELSLISSGDDESLITICNNLLNLEYLYIKFASAYNNEGVKDLWKLRKLKFLQINGCQNVTAKGFIEGLKERNDNLHSLTLRFYVNCENIFSHISKNFVNLRELEIRCASGIEDTEIQSVWNLRWLRTFHIACDSGMLSDFAFTGISSEDEKEGLIGYSIARVEGLKNLTSSIKNNITTKTLNEIAKLKELKSLELRCGLKFEMDEFKVLSSCKSIEDFSIILPEDQNCSGKEDVLNYFPRIKIMSISAENTYPDCCSYSECDSYSESDGD